VIGDRARLSMLWPDFAGRLARRRSEQSSPRAPQAPLQTDTDHHFAPLRYLTAPWR